MSTRTFRTSALFAAVFLTAAVLPPTLHAQVNAASVNDTVLSMPSAPRAVIATDASTTPGPRAVVAGISRPVLANPLGVAEPAPDSHVGAGSNLAMMAVGAAGVIVGLMIGGNGGTILAIGGGVIGLVGLYHFVR